MVLQKRFERFSGTETFGKIPLSQDMEYRRLRMGASLEAQLFSIIVRTAYKPEDFWVSNFRRIVGISLTVNLSPGRA